jgi:hypothetical protein
LIAVGNDGSGAVTKNGVACATTIAAWLWKIKRLDQFQINGTSPALSLFSTVTYRFSDPTMRFPHVFAGR